jgi:hypothetical protein
LPCAATLINLDLYNPESLLDSDAFTPLQGNTVAGDLVQVILTADNTINAPDQFGNPSGDDMLLFAGDPRLHVGYGVPFNPDQGLLDVFPLQYDSSLVGTNIYVRFWNAATVGAATYYGNSVLTNLPAGTGPGSDQAQLDFVPSPEFPHVTDQPFSALVIPEPSNLFLFGMMIWGVRAWRRRAKLATAQATWSQ